MTSIRFKKKNDEMKYSDIKSHNILVWLFASVFIETLVILN